MVLSKEERKERKRIASKKFYQNHIEEEKKRKKIYYIDHREEIRERQKEYEQEHKQEKNERAKKYYLEHKKEILLDYKNRYKDDPKYSEKISIKNRKKRDKDMWLVDIFLYPYKCYQCNRKYDKVCLDWHHINPELKKFGIGVKYYLEKSQPLELIEELLKCVILCSNCHRLVEYKKIELKKIKNRLI